MLPLYLVNHSTNGIVTPDFMVNAMRSVNIQLREAALAHAQQPFTFIRDKGLEGKIPVIGIFDHPDQANALGYHDTDPTGQPFGSVFTENQTLEDIGVTLSHESLELQGDPYADTYIIDDYGDGEAFELSDRCEDVVYRDRFGFLLSDYLLPPAFHKKMKGQIDRQNVLNGNNERTPGGYAILITGGQISTDPPEAMAREKKQRPTSRTARRIRHFHEKVERAAHHEKGREALIERVPGQSPIDPDKLAEERKRRLADYLRTP